jgi:hypothetical protein
MDLERWGRVMPPKGMTEGIAEGERLSMGSEDERKGGERECAEQR